MPKKNEIAHEMRKEFINKHVTRLIKTKKFASVDAIHQHIADFYLFCDKSTVKRALLPYNGCNTSITKKNQLSINL